MLPDLMGYEVCSNIKEKYSLFQLPILIMTADNRVENLVISFECEANDYLKKSLNKQVLSLRVNTLLSLKRSVEEALTLTQQVVVATNQVQCLREVNL
jgi:two-component system, sensor histidine kinase ChiS